MRGFSLSAAALIGAITTTAPATAAECTVEQDTIETALQRAPSCDRAYRLFEA